jgi:hypothetical protein
MEDPNRAAVEQQDPAGGVGDDTGLLPALLDGSGDPRSRPNKRQQHGGGDFFPLFFSSSAAAALAQRGRVVVVAEKGGGVEGGGGSLAARQVRGLGPRIRSRPSDPPAPPKSSERARADRCLSPRIYTWPLQGAAGPTRSGPSVSPRREGTAATGLEQCGLPSERPSHMLSFLLPACVAA